MIKHGGFSATIIADPKQYLTRKKQRLSHLIMRYHWTSDEHKKQKRVWYCPFPFWFFPFPAVLPQFGTPPSHQVFAFP